MKLDNVKSFVGILVLGALLGFLLSHNLKQDPSSVAKVEAPLVVTELPKAEMMGEYIKLTGNVVAMNSVDLVARVEGFLQTLTFKDGSEVKKGQPLFVIEPQPYEESLNEAKASLAAEKASLAYTSSEYERQVRLIRQNATSQSDLESWLARKNEAAANVLKAEANLQTAKINYSYTHVYAPFDGRIGRHMVDIGNLVGSGSPTTIATIDQISPLYVYFNLNELDLLRLRKEAKKHGFNPKNIAKIKVGIGLQDDIGYPLEGALDFVNIGVDASTGTMQLRALVTNEERQLLPGLFVRIRVPINPVISRLTVPWSSLQYDQTGPYLFVVNDQKVVEIKRVTLGPREEDRQSIKEGLSASDKVITKGGQFVTPGKKVRLQA
jgi:RND family efflux transporter MFP subunit